MKDSMKDTLTQVGDGTAISNAVATIMGLLPDLAALLSIFWLGSRLWDRFILKRKVK